jgi:hypothetical protein
MKMWFSMHIQNGLKLGKHVFTSQSKPKNLFSQVNPLDTPAFSEETKRRKLHKKQKEPRYMEEGRGNLNHMCAGASKH